MRKEEYFGRNSLSLRFYDILTNLDHGLRGDGAFYARGLAATDTVLEIGCGTGRVSLGLAQLGFRVVGIDIAEGMIERANLKGGAMPPQVASRVQFMVCDMLALDLPARFSRILIPFYTFNFLPRRADRAKALKVAARHLAPGGKLIIHTIPVERLRTKKPPKMDDSADITVNFNDGTRLEILWGDRLVDHERQMTRQMVVYRHRAQGGNLLDETIEALNYSWVKSREIDIAARKAELSLLQTLTSFIDGEDGNEDIYILEHRRRVLRRA